MEFLCLMGALCLCVVGIVEIGNNFGKVCGILALLSVVTFLYMISIEYKEFSNEHVKTNSFVYSEKITIKSDKVFDAHTIVQKPFKLSWSEKTKTTIKIGDETIIIYDEM